MLFTSFRFCAGEGRRISGELSGVEGLAGLDPVVGFFRGKDSVQ